MSQNPSNDTSNTHFGADELPEEEWIEFCHLMHSLEEKVSSGEKLSEEETEFFEKYYKTYRFHMELGKRYPKITTLVEKLEGLTEKASQEIEKLNKTLEKR
jgi:hypothetical protein